jgi:hypothetical protein
MSTTTTRRSVITEVASLGHFDRDRCILKLRLPAGMKLLLSAINDYGDDCFARVDTLAVKLAVHPKTVQRWIRSLREKGLMHSMRTGRSNSYAIHWDRVAQFNDQLGATVLHQREQPCSIRGSNRAPSEGATVLHQREQPCSIASDSINGLFNGLDNDHHNAALVVGENSSEKPLSHRSIAAAIVADWYRRANRLPPARPLTEHQAIEKLLRDHGEPAVRRAVDWSITFVRDRFTSCTFLAGAMNQIEQRLSKESEQRAVVAEREQRERERRQRERQAEAFLADEQRRKWSHWDSLSEAEQEGRLRVVAAACPRGAHELFVRTQAVAEAWEDHLTSRHGGFL